MKKAFSLALLILFTVIVFPQEKTPAAFIDLKPGNGINEGLSVTVSDYFRTQLVNMGRFLIVSRENMEDILTEQQYQISGCTSEECLVQMGKILGVRYMFTGTLGKVGSIFLINIKLLNVETGEIADAESAEASSEEGLLSEIRKISARLSGIEPAEVPEKPPVRIPVEKRAQKVSSKHNFAIVTYGFGRGSTRLNFSNLDNNILKSHLGITGDYSDPLDDIEWRHLLTDYSTPMTLRIGGTFDFKEGKRGFPGFNVEIFYQKAEINSDYSQETYIDGYNVGSTDFAGRPYLAISQLAVDAQILYYIRAVSFLSLFAGAGFGLTMNSWSSEYLMGYTTGSGDFEGPVSGYNYGFMVHMPAGFMFDIYGIVFTAEIGFWATLFTFTRGISNEKDTADMLVPQLKFGIGGKF